MMARKAMFWRREIGPFHDGATRLVPGFSMAARISPEGDVLGNPRGTTQVLRMGEVDVRLEMRRRSPEGAAVPDAQRNALRAVATTMVAEVLRAAGDTIGIIVLPGTKVDALLVDNVVLRGVVMYHTPGTEITVLVSKEDSDDAFEHTIALEGHALTVVGETICIRPAAKDDDIVIRMYEDEALLTEEEEDEAIWEEEEDVGAKSDRAAALDEHDRKYIAVIVRQEFLLGFLRDRESSCARMAVERLCTLIERDHEIHMGQSDLDLFLSYLDIGTMREMVMLWASTKQLDHLKNHGQTSSIRELAQEIMGGALPALPDA